MDKVKDMQKAMNLPVVYDESISTSGRDCSFLDFSNKSINLDPLKYDSFCFANLNGAKFIYKNFCSTIFFGASLLNTDFGNGSFCSSQGHHPNFNDAKLNVKTYSTIKKEYHDEIMYYL